jgi:hypothetical protein
MRNPSFKELAKQKAEGDTRCLSYAMPLHPNPYFYKYTYRVFWRKSPNDGGIFLHHPKNKLCLYDTQALIEKLRAQNEIYWLYNGTILLRNTPNSLLSIIDRTSPRWKNTDFNQLAPSFDEDTDPIVYCDGVGFK